MTDEDMAVEQEPELETTEEELSEDELAMAKLKEAISVTKEEIGSLRLKLTITVPEAMLNERRGDQFAELKRDSIIPGFRKGHAPLKLVEKRFASDVGEQLRTQIIGSGYVAATEKEEINTLGDPLFWVKVEEERVGEDDRPRTVEREKLLPIDKALEHMTLPTTGDLTYSCEVELKPEFELPTLEKIPVKRPVVTIEDDDVDEELKRMRMSRATFKPVDGGCVEADDMLYADMKMLVDGDVIESEDNFDLAARNLRIKGVPLLGFGDAVVGKKVGETATFEATVPDDHENIDIRGKTARFEFVLREIKRLVLPPIDQEFLTKTGFETEKELRKTLREYMEARMESTVQRALREQIGDWLVENTKLDIPDGLSQRQTDRSIQRRMIDMYRANVPEAEIAKLVDEMRAKAHDQAVRDLKLYFVLEKIGDERNVEVGEDQVNGAIADIARQANKRFDRVRDELSKGDGLSTLYLQLRDQKVLDELLTEAEITDVERPNKKTAAKKKATKAKASGAEDSAKPEAKQATPKKPSAKKKTVKKTTAKKSGDAGS